MTTTSALNVLQERSSGAWATYKDIQKDLIDLSTEIEDLKVAENEISEKLAKHDASDIAQKEGARTRAKTKRDEARARQVTLEVKRERLESERSRLRSELKQLVSESEAAKRFVRRAQITGDLIGHLQSKLNEEKEFARLAIKMKIDKIIKEFMRKNLTVRITEDYQLKVFDENNNEASKSTGENQLLGLAFTGAISAFASDRQHEDTDILLPGTEAPIVVDSPFGHLDPTYRRGVADFLPKLARQVVLLVSTSQASQEVMEELEGKIGSQYILTSHNETDGDDKQKEIITINGKSYDLTKYNQNFTGTLLMEVN
jgi:DNA sulfur modification protein DndD